MTTKNAPFLEEFFATTTNSVYHVKVIKGIPILKKLAETNDKGRKKLVENYKQLDGGSLLSIGKRLILFFPTNGGTVFERRIEKISPCHWGEQTALVVALFSGKDTALKCFYEIDPCSSPNDPRWAKDTSKVLNEIGDRHPIFSICNDSELSLG